QNRHERVVPAHVRQRRRRRGRGRGIRHEIARRALIHGRRRLSLAAEDVMQIQQKVEAAINTLIASEAALYFKTKKAHWLVEGKAFQALHTMLDEQAGQIVAAIDELAERIVMLRGVPTAGLADYQRNSIVKDLAPGRQDVPTFLSTLAQDHEN